jgi:hypothetical protein
MSSRLIIGGERGRAATMFGAGTPNIEGVELDLDKTVPFPISYSVAEVRNPESRKRSSSKTVKIPATSNNRRVFKAFYLMDVDNISNMSGVVFDTTARIEAKYYYNGMLLFDGLIRLMDIEVSGGEMTFNCVLFSDFIGLFKQLGNKMLSDLDWSEYDHDLTKTNVANSWDTSVIQDGVAVSNFVAGNPSGFGYCYPMIDWGLAVDSSTKKFRTKDLIPAVYVKEAFEKCFAETGLTIDSDFMSGGGGSFLFRKLLLTWEGGEPLGLTTSEQDDLKIEATIEPIDKSYEKEFTIEQASENNPISVVTGFNTSMNSATATIGETADVSNQFNTTSAVTKIFYTGGYKISLDFVVDLALSLSSYLVWNWYDTSAKVSFNVQMYKNGVKVLTKSNEVTVSGTVATDLTGTLNTTHDIEINATSGDTFYFVVNMSTVDVPLAWIDLFNYDSALFSMDYAFTSGFDYTLTPLDIPYQDNSNVSLSRFVPKMKCTDFLKGIFQMFNLFMTEPDKDGETTVVPLNDFYSETDTFEDWSEIVDYSKPQKITPASTLVDAGTYKFNFAEEKDYHNEYYKGRFGKQYGEYEYSTANELSIKEKAFKLPFSVLIPDDIATGFIVPRVVQLNGQGVTVPHKGKPKITVYNGLYTTDWYFQDSDGATQTTEASYPQVNHLEDIDSPISDLLWSYPQYLFWSQATYTTNNLFDYYQKNILEMSSANSKLYTCYVKLKPLDVFNLDFSLLKMINGTLYRLNNLKDYDPQKGDTVQVELLRVLEGDSVSSPSGGGGGGAGADPEVPGGEGMGFYVSQPIALTIDAVMEPATTQILLTDNDAINDTITLPEPLIGTKVIIKKISATDIPLTIAPYNTDLIDGEASLILIRQYESRTLIADGTDYYIY